jgi:hypothetical protein
MSEAQPLIKLGAVADGIETPVRYPNVWSVEQTSGPERLIIGPSERHIDVLLSLADEWRGDYGLLYVLVVPRLGNREPGRYQSPDPLSFDQVTCFCRRFGRFLESDGRHHLWIGSTVNSGQLIYDQHNWIWAYGDLGRSIATLTNLGFQEGRVILPAPHTHHYHPENDWEEEQLASRWAWKYFPLQPGDEY